MTISKRDYNKLCKICRELNEQDGNFDLWKKLNEVIENIKE